MIECDKFTYFTTSMIHEVLMFVLGLKKVTCLLVAMVVVPSNKERFSAFFTVGLSVSCQAKCRGARKSFNGMMVF
jgi:hypothetical protein